ncbi:DUF3829 domain-containing protein [Sphingomonas sp. PB2P12]|uniref:DUF3829 domain-containing protein n=1 Tax=Sphingomonas sandaracina TaxID=3096157 RepID=UPI002FC9A73A
MTSAKINIALIVAAALSLSACDKAPFSGNASSGGLSEAGDAGGQLEGYIEAHNRLIGSFGYYERSGLYRKADVAHASTEGQFLVSDGWISKGIDALKEARAKSGAAADLNAAADALIVSLTKVDTHLADLATYYDSKKFLEDNLARGKREDPQMLAELTVADKDMDTFNRLLERDIAKRDQVVLEKLKSEGDLLAYNSKLALMHSNALISMFNTADDLRSSAIFARADAEVAVIEKAIDDAHQQAAKVGKKDPSELDALKTMIGYYRSLKKKHEASDAEGMMRNYNTAVDAANRPMPSS